MVHMAIKVEQQLKRKGSRSFQNLGSFGSWRSNGRKNEGAVFKSKTEPPKRRDEAPIVTKVKMNPKLVIVILSVFVVWE